MSAPTIDEIIDDVLDNADFEEESSVSRARAFITAAKRYMLISPQSQTDQGSSMTMSVAQIESMVRRAQQFVDVKSTAAATSQVRFLSASEGFRR